MTKIAFLDTETTGLGPKTEVWEIGLVLRTFEATDEDDRTPPAYVDTEYCWRIRPRMKHAEPTGLRIGRYYERMDNLANYPVGQARRVVHPHFEGEDEPSRATEARFVAMDLVQFLDGATIVGAVPDFDTRQLGRFLKRWNQAGTWHYHLVDVETLAAGHLGRRPPWGVDDLLGEFGLRYDEADRHTALGDARMVRDLYDAVFRRAEENRDMWSQDQVEQFTKRIAAAAAAGPDEAKALADSAHYGPIASQF